MTVVWWILQFVNENKNLLRIQQKQLRNASKLHT